MILTSIIYSEPPTLFDSNVVYNKLRKSLDKWNKKQLESRVSQWWFKTLQFLIIENVFLMVFSPFLGGIFYIFGVNTHSDVQIEKE